MSLAVSGYFKRNRVFGRMAINGLSTRIDTFVIPAQAGTQRHVGGWIPACAGMTVGVRVMWQALDAALVRVLLKMMRGPFPHVGRSGSAIRTSYVFQPTTPSGQGRSPCQEVQAVQ